MVKNSKAALKFGYRFLFELGFQNILFRGKRFINISP